MTERRFIKTRIEEAFPVLYSHVNYPENRKRETARGPFYAAGSESRDLFSDKMLAACNARADHLRAGGWTVSVEVVA